MGSKGICKFFWLQVADYNFVLSLIIHAYECLENITEENKKERKIA